MILLSIVGIVLLLIGGAFAIGATLPVGHTASVKIVVNAPPEAVWNVVTDYKEFPKWRTELAEVQPVEDPQGRASWIEVSKFGEMPLTVEESDPPRHLLTRISGKDLQFGGTWSWRLDPQGDKTEITVTENGEVYSPLFRFISKFIFGHDTHLKSYAKQLEAKLQADVN
ncbi:MAG: SRPBCC family protein [Fimbriimonadaceae bacterium]|nr:MAG: SRPBCC family protein [Fimbriimonadaceae bacterium]